MKEIRLPNEVRFILDKLNESGYRAYIVGGCVRDSIMGKEPKDWDVCTSATPDQIKAVFDRYRTIDTGIKHGTVTVVLSNDQYEITTFRIDGKYSDARHPDSVLFTSEITEDLSRRDFTMNAIAYHPMEGYIDPFHGYTDIENKLIRCVGDPKKRFSEDALRIIRAMRFSSVLGFDITENTHTEMKNMSHLISNVSQERISSELSRLVCGVNCMNVMQMNPEIMTRIVPELTSCVGFNQLNPHHDFTLYGHIVRSVWFYDGDDLVVKLALLMHDIGKPLSQTIDKDGIAHYYHHEEVGYKLANTALRTLRFDNKTIKDVVELIYYHDSEINESERAVKRWLNKIGTRQFDRLLSVMMADTLAKTNNPDRAKIEHIRGLTRTFEIILLTGPCLSLKDLHVNGNDIIKLGVSQGRAVGEILNVLLNLVIDGFLENKREVLLKEAAVLAKYYIPKE